MDTEPSLAEAQLDGSPRAADLVFRLIAREGILYACMSKDLTCLDAARTFATTQTTQSSLTFQNIFWGLRGPVIEIVLIMTPPRKN